MMMPPFQRLLQDNSAAVGVVAAGECIAVAGDFEFLDAVTAAVELAVDH